MELKEMIGKLLDSEILENNELGVTLLRSDQVSDEEKQVFIDGFVEEYKKNYHLFLTEEKKNLFDCWSELYKASVKGNIKNRVKKII